MLSRHSASTAANRYRSLQQLFKWLLAEDVLTIIEPDLGSWRVTAVRPSPGLDRLVLARL